MSNMNEGQGAGDMMQVPTVEPCQNPVFSVSEGWPQQQAQQAVGGWPQQPVQQTPEGWPQQPVCQSPAELHDPFARSESKTVVFTAREWAGVVLAVSLAVLWFSIFSFESLFTGGWSLPGIGIPLFVAAFFTSLFVLLGKRITIRLSSAALLGAIFALSLIPALYSDQWLRGANCFLLTGLCLIEFLLLSGFGQKAWCRIATVGEALGFFFISLVRYFPRPFKALGNIHVRGARNVGGIVIGFLIALLLLLIILPLLISADAVFGGFFTDFGTWLASIKPLDALWKTARVILVAPLLFSLLYAAFHQDGASLKVKEAIPQSESRPFSAIPLATVLIVLDLVFVLFVAVQFAFLFGGSEASQISGGYAQYARSGFFQLVAVAAINLVTVLVAVRFGKSEALSRVVLGVCEVVLIACTAVILASAWWRMDLYISEYGLSLLRCLTLLGIAFIAVCLVAAAIKVFKHDFMFFRVFFVAGIILWGAFNFLNVDARIAEYNVEGYLSGRIEQIDISYLASLSSDTLPALEVLAAQEPAYAVEVGFWEDYYALSGKDIPWYKWSYSALQGSRL